MRLRHALLTIPLAVLPVVVATPAHALTCPLLVDPLNDGAFLGNASLQSAQVDIVSADVASGASTVVAVLRVRSLDGDLLSNLGVEWSFGWKIGSTRYGVFARRTVGVNTTYIPAFTVNGASAGPVHLAVDVVNDTITWTVDRSLLPDLATPGATFGDLAAITKLLSSSSDVAFSTATYVDQSPGCIPAA